MTCLCVFIWTKNRRIVHHGSARTLGAWWSYCLLLAVHSWEKCCRKIDPRFATPDSQFERTSRSVVDWFRNFWHFLVQKWLKLNKRLTKRISSSFGFYWISYITMNKPLCNGTVLTSCSIFKNILPVFLFEKDQLSCTAPIYATKW